MSKYWTFQEYIENKNVLFEEVDNKKERAQHYTENAISNAKNGHIDEAKIGFMIATILYESLQLYNEVEKVYFMLIALYDKEGDHYSILDIYLGLSIYFRLHDCGDKTTKYIKAANGLTGEIIGKKDPSPEELFENFVKRAKENQQHKNISKKLSKLLDEQLLGLQ